MTSEQASPGLCISAAIMYSLALVWMSPVLGCLDFYSTCQGEIMWHLYAGLSLKLFKVLFEKGAYVHIVPPFFRLDLLAHLCRDG